MAEILGEILDLAFGGHLLPTGADWPIELESYDETTYVGYAPCTHSVLAEGSLQNPRVINVPSVFTVQKAAEKLDCYVDDFYYRVHVIPGSLNLGNVSTGQISYFTVWNAWFVPKSLASIVEDSTEGLILSGPQVPPTTFGGLEERQYSVEITSKAAVYIDSTYTFDFGTETPVLQVTGVRLVLFPYRPQIPLQEYAVWNTEVIESYNGTEERTELRDVPLQRYGWKVLVQDRAFNSLLRGWHNRIFILPMWQDQISSAVNIPIGTTTIDVSTTHGEWRGYLILWESPTENETAEIESVSLGVATLASPTTKAFSAGVTILPGRFARLSKQSKWDEGYKLDILNLEWIVQDQENLPVVDLSSQYDGLDVYTDFIYTEGGKVKHTLTTPLIEIDFGSGPIFYDSRYDGTDIGYDQLLVLKFDRDLAWLFKRWLYKMKGKSGEFWLPSNNYDITIVEPFTDTDTSFVIQNIKYAEFLSSQASNKHLAFYIGETKYYREILGSMAIDADTERISLSAPFGFSGTGSTFNRISWMNKVRLASDQVQITWEGTNSGQAALPLKGVE